MSFDVAALPFQAHANYGTWSIDFGTKFLWWQIYTLLGLFLCNFVHFWLPKRRLKSPKSTLIFKFYIDSLNDNVLSNNGKIIEIEIQIAGKT